MCASMTSTDVSLPSRIAEASSDALICRIGQNDILAWIGAFVTVPKECFLRSRRYTHPNITRRSTTPAVYHNRIFAIASNTDTDVPCIRVSSGATFTAVEMTLSLHRRGTLIVARLIHTEKKAGELPKVVVLFAARLSSISQEKHFAIDTIKS